MNSDPGFAEWKNQAQNYFLTINYFLVFWRKKLRLNFGTLKNLKSCPENLKGLIFQIFFFDILTLVKAIVGSVPGAKF